MQWLSHKVGFSLWFQQTVIVWGQGLLFVCLFLNQLCTGLLRNSKCLQQQGKTGSLAATQNQLIRKHKLAWTESTLFSQAAFSFPSPSSLVISTGTYEIHFLHRNSYSHEVQNLELYSNFQQRNQLLLQAVINPAKAGREQ